MSERDIERVLKAAGRRERAPAEIEDAVREHVRAEWRAVVAERRGRRRAAASLALAASLLVAALGVWLAMDGPGTQAPIATMAVALDDVEVRAGWLRGWERIGAGRKLSAGALLRTGANGRAALVLAGIASARLDHGTRLRIAAADRLVIESGALYVDAGDDAPAEVPLAVETPAGVVRHVGTQYEVRVEGAGVRLRVREGRVEWRSNAGSVENGRAGEQLTISADGAVSRLPAARFGEAWDWVAAATPAIDIEGRPLSEFLAWAGRELGREIVFATPDVAEEASSIVVHGSIDGLTPAQALEAVLETTSVRGRFAGDRIVVRRESIDDERRSN